MFKSGDKGIGFFEVDTFERICVRKEFGVARDNSEILVAVYPQNGGTSDFAGVCRNEKWFMLFGDGKTDVKSNEGFNLVPGLVGFFIPSENLGT